MRALCVVVVLALTSALAACAPAVPARDQAYYFAHAADRTSTLAECRNNPGAFGRTSNCANATAAAGKIESDRFWAIKKPKSRVANPSSL
ncbi:MAG TPA: EexN family lipoprotein [Caulobacteraceae bacterium]